MMQYISLGFFGALFVGLFFLWQAIIDLTGTVKRLARQIDREQVLTTQLQDEISRQGEILGMVCQSLLRSNILPSENDD